MPSSPTARRHPWRPPARKGGQRPKAGPGLAWPSRPGSGARCPPQGGPLRWSGPPRRGRGPAGGPGRVLIPQDGLPSPPPVGTRVSLLPPCVCRGKAWLQPAGRLSSPHAGCPSFALQAGPPPRGPFRGERCFPSAPSRLSSHPDPPGSARPRGRVSFFSRYCGERRVAGKTPLHPRQILLQGDAGYRRGLAGVCCWKARAGGAV